MSVRLAVGGAAVAGLLAVGALGAVTLFQPVPARSVQFVSPASVVSTPTVEPTVEPTAVPTTAAPAPVESTQAPAPVVAPAPVKVVTVPKPVTPAQPAPSPSVAPTYSDGTKAEAGKYPDGTPARYDAIGTVIPFPPNCTNGDGTIVKADWSSGLPVCVTH